MGSVASIHLTLHDKTEPKINADSIDQVVYCCLPCSRGIISYNKHQLRFQRTRTQWLQLLWV